MCPLGGRMAPPKAKNSKVAWRQRKEVAVRLGRKSRKSKSSEDYDDDDNIIGGLRLLKRGWFCIRRIIFVCCVIDVYIRKFEEESVSRRNQPRRKQMMMLTLALGNPEYPGSAAVLGGSSKAFAYFHLPKRPMLNVEDSVRALIFPEKMRSKCSPPLPTLEHLQVGISEYRNPNSGDGGVLGDGHSVPAHTGRPNQGLRLQLIGESAFLSKALDEIRREAKSTDPDTKSAALLKLTYLSSLHFHDMSFAAFHVVELLSSTRFSHKKIAYHAASHSFDDSTPVLVLITNQLRKDLTSTNEFEVSLALGMPFQNCHCRSR
ncbi:hypothetical protein J5N97_002035 [Dioscorea zingiberensis]|uniref:Clathrin/coatomer adaptor adaptin-like N-terminal domain-containing protein n=1 Tax=Dioscorea zingiberensis TaxID=325984 RepID=A0A9D5H1S1_9LILI|nr:hypothetical protein J5N97_002035 [Dioscorea zingiberensis]